MTKDLTKVGSTKTKIQMSLGYNESWKSSIRFNPLSVYAAPPLSPFISDEMAQVIILTAEPLLAEELHC